ncbi:MAG: hypothetical protein OEY87_04195 [Gammaproteobacteria bacterium]|nr:hypothetical protein [Gammaproteobacteria bacterium]MDH5735304.1 hypothetical protein [Gammaproteobacteria bacterium]
MKFYIKEINDHTVTLMTEAGHVLAYFPTVIEALNACDEWYMVNHNAPDHQIKVHCRNINNQFYDDLEVA